jgi:hypothetical protein
VNEDSITDRIVKAMAQLVYYLIGSSYVCILTETTIGDNLRRDRNIFLVSGDLGGVCHAPRVKRSVDEDSRHRPTRKTTE